MTTSLPVAVRPPRKIAAHLSAWVFRYHRWLGVISCVAVILWGASGVMHPIMSRINPTPVNMSPPMEAVRLHGALTPAEILARAGIAEVAELRVLAWNGATYYQVRMPNLAEHCYFEVNSGVELADGDAKYAEYLARHFIGDTRSELRDVALVTQFADDYLDINRLLPVYRVELARADGLRAYVETNPPRVSALVDDRKALLGSLFRFMHNWEFLRAAETLRITLISAFLGVTLLSALSGIWMYGFMWQRGTLQAQHASLRRWHRALGMFISLSALLFVVSAEWHLLGSEPRKVAPQFEAHIPAEQILLPAILRHGTWGGADLLQVAGEARYLLQVWQAQPSSPAGSDEHVHGRKPAGGGGAQALYVNMQGEVMPDAGREHAVWLAGEFSRLAPDKVQKVAPLSKFEGEYGFLNKRLPVWRVDYATAEHLSYYVETRTGTLAAVVRDADRAEGWSFAYLHKYHWLDFAGKDVRDLVMGLFGLGNLVIALLGLWMFGRRYRGARHAAP
jgi:hypothetical protein